MPTNIQKGNTAEFIVEFLDSSGNITIPAGGTLTITYTLGITTASTTLTLSQVGSFFTANWDSSVADYGPAPWSVIATGSSVVALTGDLRVIDP